MRQAAVPNKMRGRATAVYLLVINLVGLGLGPMLLPLVSDYVFRDEMQIHFALLTVTLVAEVGAAILLALGLPRFRRALEYRAQWLERAAR